MWRRSRAGLDLSGSTQSECRHDLAASPTLDGPSAAPGLTGLFLPTLSTAAGRRYGAAVREPLPKPDVDALPRDPFAAVAPPRRGAWVLGAVVVLVVLVLGGVVAVGLAARAWLTPAPPAPTSVITVRPTAAILVAVRDLARLETGEVHVEKVIDLTDQQKRLFGLIDATDALLLVAVGHGTLGVDLSKVRDDDITMDAAGKVATLRLPPIELLQAGLDEDATYVYTRSTSVLARRNEHLEAQARREAVAAIKRAATTPDMMSRARVQAERQIRALVSRLGAERVEITWRE